MGAVFTSQMAVVDPTYNTLGLRMSDYIKWTVGKGLEGVIDGFTFYAYQSHRSAGSYDIVHADHISHGPPDVLQAHDQDGGHAKLISNGKLEDREQHV